MKETTMICLVIIALTIIIFGCILIMINLVGDITIKQECIQRGSDYISFKEGKISFSYCGDINKVLNMINEVKGIK